MATRDSAPRPEPDLMPPFEPDAGGDPACWLSQLCPECGAMLEGAPVCWRCRTPVDRRQFER